VSISLTSSRLKRVRDDKSSFSDSDVESHPIRGKRILRSRIIGTVSDNSDPIVLSGVSAKVRGRKPRACNRN